MTLTPYEPRLIAPLGLKEIGGFRIKIYGINDPAKGLCSAALAIADRFLTDTPTSRSHYGVGFLGIHQGRTENQVFLDIWIEENELTHDFWVSPTVEPTLLRRPPKDHNSVCVWDLFVQSVERQAWLDHVLRNPAGPDIEAVSSRLL